MLTPPAFPAGRDVLRAVAAHWLPGADGVEYLPWGFGGHHWRVTGGGVGGGAGGGAALFVTLDRLEPRHTAESLEAAYAGAAALAAAGLEAVCAPLPAGSGRYTVPLGGGALSVTPWLEGRSPTEEEAAERGHAAEVVRTLEALHGPAPGTAPGPPAEPLAGALARLPVWAPRVGPGFADAVRARTAEPWVSGPLGEDARAALAAHADAVRRWTDRYLHLADVARSRRAAWVPTHGEPHHANQLLTPGGLRLVDWESLALAPRERDYADVPAGLRDRLRPDPAMLELFALDWRLAEIDEYVRWFTAPHTGSADDHAALGGLHEELADGIAADVDGGRADADGADAGTADADAADADTADADREG